MKKNYIHPLVAVMAVCNEMCQMSMPFSDEPATGGGDAKLSMVIGFEEEEPDDDDFVVPRLCYSVWDEEEE